MAQNSGPYFLGGSVILAAAIAWAGATVAAQLKSVAWTYSVNSGRGDGIIVKWDPVSMKAVEVTSRASGQEDELQATMEWISKVHSRVDAYRSSQSDVGYSPEIALPR